MVICWSVPLVATIPLVTEDYGPAGSFCWLKSNLGHDLSPTSSAEVLKLAMLECQ